MARPGSTPGRAGRYSRTWDGAQQYVFTTDLFRCSQCRVRGGGPGRGRPEGAADRRLYMTATPRASHAPIGGARCLPGPPGQVAPELLRWAGPVPLMSVLVGLRWGGVRAGTDSWRRPRRS